MAVEPQLLSAISTIHIVCITICTFEIPAYVPPLPKKGAIGHILKCF
jgi:hypothetical protein